MNLRQALAEAKIALRQAKDTHDTAKIIATLDVSGRNEAERKRNTARALLNDRAYTLALAFVRACEATVERAEAEIAEQEYELRIREVVARERLAEALMGRRSDDAMIDRVIQYIVPSARGGHQYIAHRNCQIPNCNICDGDLAQCVVCGGAECELPSDCPGKPMTPNQREAFLR